MATAKQQEHQPLLNSLRSRKLGAEVRDEPSPKSVAPELQANISNKRINSVGEAHDQKVNTLSFNNFLYLLA